MLCLLIFCNGVLKYFLGKVFGKIHHHHPCKRRNRVNQHHINMLETMCRYPFLRGTLSHDRAFRNIIIDSIYVGIGMMNNIMFELPDKCITSQGIQGKA